MKTRVDLSVMNKLLLLFLPNVTLIEVPFYKNGRKLTPKDKNGSGIHIKKKNRGKFTKSAEKAGKSVQLHAHDVVNNPNATSLLKKRALFAINAKKWKH